ncbi:MAG: ABC transporter permease, partial [Vicinamibacterales bacterium]
MTAIGSLLRDIRHSFRVLFKSPAFLVAAVSILALGIGANAVMFSVVNAVVIRPLSFPNAEHLVRVWHTPPAAQFPGLETFSVSPANYLDWRAQNDVFDRMAIYTRAAMSLTGPGQQPESIRSAVVSVDFFDVLGVKPIRGRLFEAGEDEEGND